jgi:hypothetical protein
MSHHDESLIDKVKDALGFGDGDRDADRRTDTTDATTRDDAALDTDARTDGWAGVDEALSDDVANRPAGPDYGATDATGTRYADDAVGSTTPYAGDEVAGTTYSGATDTGLGMDDPATTYETPTGTATGTEAVEDDVELARRDEGLPR